jgi:SAM-dependent methyltransferase
VQAALYDLQNEWGPSDDYYLSRVMAARSALDVGCGTGTLLVEARRRGHPGELVGVDPARAMLAVASAKAADVIWQRSSAEELQLGRIFDLITMTGHAFQTLVEDDAIRAALRNFREHLSRHGHVVFETRNPLARAWETWHAAAPVTVALPDGGQVRYAYEVMSVREEIVEFAENAVWVSGEETRHVQSLRFLSLNRLRSFMSESGLIIEEVHGDWDASPLEEGSPEIIVSGFRAN